MTMVSGKQAKVRDYVIDALRRGEMRPGQRLENDRELSVRLGVSRVTLGRGLNMLVERGVLRRKVGSGTYVAEAAERLSSDGRRDSLAVPDKVGLVISGSGGPLALALQQGAHHVFPKNKCDIVVKDPEGDPEQERELVRDLVDRGAEALIVTSCAPFLDVGFREFYRGVAAEVPLVMCDRALYDPRLNSVSTDNVLGGVMAAEFLGVRAVERRNFWALRHDWPCSSLWEREMGFQFGLAARWGVEPGQVETISLPSDHARAAELLRKRFQDGPAPDGLFVLTDGLLRLFIDFVRSSGLTLNACCFDNFFKTADLFDIPCLEQDFVGIGAEVARILAAIKACPGGPVRNVKIPPRWGED